MADNPDPGVGAGAAGGCSSSAWPYAAGAATHNDDHGCTHYNDDTSNHHHDRTDYYYNRGHHNHDHNRTDDHHDRRA